ncbi:MAG: arylsulfotransferase family protein, partial [Myxococcota bacterium]|nr:arylsulfotransferase family protein [Myxococcota bacterium]
PERTLADGAEQQLLLGIPYGTDVEIRLVRDGKTSESTTARTGDLPGDLPVPEYVSGDPDQWWEDGRYVYTSINQDEENWSGDRFWKVILDRQGRVVWALLTPVNRWTLWTDLSNDGRYLVWDEITVYDWGSSDPSMIHKMTIDGTIVQSYEADGLHHAWDELSDGSFVWGAEINGNEEWLQRRHTDDTVETLWKCSEFEVEQLGSTANDCHSNSWWWHEETDTYLVSFPSSAGQVRDTVLHIDAEGNTLSNWGNLSDWEFEDEANTFDYQHGVTFTDEGTLLLSTQLTRDNPYYQNGYDTLAVREYELDYDNLVLRQIWAFGEDQAIAGKYAGEAHRLANGNTLHNYGTGARMREITPGGELVWDVKFPGGNTEGNGRLQGRSVFVTDLYDFAP